MYGHCLHVSVSPVYGHCLHVSVCPVSGHCLHVSVSPVYGHCLHVSVCPVSGHCLHVSVCPVSGHSLHVSVCPVSGHCLHVSMYSVIGLYVKETMSNVEHLVYQGPICDLHVQHFQQSSFFKDYPTVLLCTFHSSNYNMTKKISIGPVCSWWRVYLTQVYSMLKLEWLYIVWYICKLNGLLSAMPSYYSCLSSHGGSLSVITRNRYVVCHPILLNNILEFIYFGCCLLGNHLDVSYCVYIH